MTNRGITKIQTTIAGFQGKPCTVLSAYDLDRKILVVHAETDYRDERVEGCAVITNIQELDRDRLFSADEFKDSIHAFDTLRNGVASDGVSSRLVFGERAKRADPNAVVEQDGISESGIKFRVSPEATNAHVAVLAACWYAVQCDAIGRTVDYFDDLNELLQGQVVTIG